MSTHPSSTTPTPLNPSFPPAVRMPRHPNEIRSMAIAVQANLVQLKVADSKRRGLESRKHEISVPSPGTVHDFRETLIDRGVVQGYSDWELRLRLHEIWGQFCLMQWALSSQGHERPNDFGESSLAITPRCVPELEIKHDEVHAFLWRLRFEQVGREHHALHETPPATADQSKSSPKRHVQLGNDDEPQALACEVPHKQNSGTITHSHLAARIPLKVFGKKPTDCSDKELLLSACEHAGMLATVRWILHRDLPWGDPRLMQTEEGPFPTDTHPPSAPSRRTGMKER